MDAIELEEMLHERLRTDGWSDARVDRNRTVVQARGQRNGLNIVVRCPRPSKQFGWGEYTHGDPCSIVVDVGDAHTGHDRWAIWHWDRPTWPDQKGIARPKLLCPVTVAEGKRRLTVATYGWPGGFSFDEGPALSAESLMNVMDLVELFTTEAKSAKAAGLFDPAWSLSRWPVSAPGPVTIGGAIARVGLGAELVAALLVGAVSRSAITALVETSLMPDRRASRFIALEIRGVVQRSSLFDRVSGPFVRTSFTLPVLSRVHSLFRLTAVNTLMEAKSSEHDLRLRVSHWNLAGESDAMVMMELPQAWAAVELSGPEWILNRVEVPGAVPEDGALRWLFDDEPRTKRMVLAAMENLNDAIRDHSRGPYR